MEEDPDIKTRETGAPDLLEYVEASVLASGATAESSVAIPRKSRSKTGLRGRAEGVVSIPAR